VHLRTLAPVLIFALAGALLVPAVAPEAQAPGKIARIGFLALGPAPAVGSSVWEALVAGLRERGWVEGRNLAIERRDARGRPERLPALAEELVRLRVELVVASGASAVASWAASSAFSLSP